MPNNLPVYSYQSFQMDEKLINDWFAGICMPQKFSLNHNPTEAKKLLNLFGIKSAMDVIIFLNSPEGKIVQSSLNKVIDQFLINQEISRFLITQMLAQQRALAFFILGLMHDKEEAQAHLQRIIIEEQQYQHLHQKKSQPSSTTESSNESGRMMDTLSEALDFYHEAQNSLEAQLENHLQEAIILEQEWLIYEGWQVFIAHETLFFNSLLQDIYRLESNLLTIEQTHKNIQQVHQIELQRLQHMCQMDEIDIDTDKLIACLQRIEGYQLQLTALNDLKQVKAQLTPEQTLILKNGKYYVLSKGTVFEHLSLEQQETAHQAYLKLTPQLGKKLNLLEQSRQSEQLSLNEKCHDLTQRSQTTRQQLNQLGMQYLSVLVGIDLVTQLKDQIRAQETQQTQQNTTPALTLKPTPKKVQEALALPSSKPVPTLTKPNSPWITSAEIFRAKLELHQFRNSISEPMQAFNANQAYATHLKQLELSTNQQIKPGVPVPPSLQQALARYPNAAMLYQQTLNLSPVEPQPTAPRPSPFKNYNGY